MLLAGADAVVQQVLVAVVVLLQHCLHAAWFPAAVVVVSYVCPDAAARTFAVAAVHAVELCTGHQRLSCAQDISN